MLVFHVTKIKEVIKKLQNYLEETKKKSDARFLKYLITMQRI